jgi:hypothetical protein
MDKTVTRAVSGRNRVLKNTAANRECLDASTARRT